MNRLTRPTITDALLVVLVLALPVWSLWRGHGRGPAAEVRVIHDGRLVGAYPLDQNRSLTLSCDHPGDVKIEVRSGRVRVVESDCPRGVCTHAGWVSTPGRTIVCVPNRLVIELRGQAPEYDVESY